MEVRDRFIFTRIIEQYEQGKRPFVAYGGSHIVTIEPALRAYLETSGASVKLIRKVV